MISLGRSAALAMLALCGLAAGSPFEDQLVPRAACSGNTATTRSEWCDYSIDTDYMTEVPTTGVTREYWFELTDVTVAPDGVERSAMAINGTIPGPTIFADWGDTVTVHVSNQLSDSNNGTSIHFHGIRQNYTNGNDGVSAITQCPTAPGDSISYTWRATQYGSSWYHSHFSLQAWDGIYGGIVINGPATADYDEDLGLLVLTDWDHQTVDELYTQAETQGAIELDNGLINGTNVWDDGGYRYNTTVESGTSYRIRLVNTAVDTHFKFSIDNHTMTVIAADFIPVTPYTATVVELAMAQRLDVVVTMDQADVADNFWIRAVPGSECSENTSQDNIRGILSYTGDISDPDTTGYDIDTTCSDETDNLVPYITKTVGSATKTNQDLQATTYANSDGLFKWYLNSTTMLVDWADPTLLQIYDGESAFADSDAVLSLDTADEWFYAAIYSSLTVAHPIHLHGHDFSVLAQGTGTFSSLDDLDLNLDNPPRRDTALLPSGGYLVIAFQTDNPGVWLMHCHIGWHTSEGFAVQFVERQSEIMDLIDTDTLSSNCDAWATHQEEDYDDQWDSGI